MSPPCGARAILSSTPAAQVLASSSPCTSIGDGLQQLGQQINEGEDQWDAIADVLQRTADEAVEPYSTRYRYFRQMIGADSEGG